MTTGTVLLTGIHQAELGFGDRVAALVDSGRVDVMRIPQGIPQPKKGPRERFYSRAQHREIYLQVRQQVKDHYRLVIDLHRGLDERGLCADVFCHDETFLRCLGARFKEFPCEHDVRLIRIISTDGRAVRLNGKSVADAKARTWIPSKMSLGRFPLYVGLEIYLPTENDGTERDWEFAHLLINQIQACTPHRPSAENHDRHRC